VGDLIYSDDSNEITFYTVERDPFEENQTRFLIGVGDLFGLDSIEFRFAQVLMRAFHLFVKKQADYGPTNIGVTGAEGIVVRFADKLSRLVNLFNQGKLREPQNEPIEDTCLDMLNYSGMMLMDFEGNWPRFTPEEAWQLEEKGG
jgi:hypothetical protein